MSFSSMAQTADKAPAKKIKPSDLIREMITTSNIKQKQRIVKFVEKKANEGDLYAMNALGMAYIQGIGVDRNTEQGVYWMDEAVKRGYGKSAYNLATMYREGIDIDQDFEKAYYYMRKGAELRIKECVFGVGYFHYKGFGCDQNYKIAVTQFYEAAKKGHIQAMHMLGLCYKNGFGVDQNPDLANEWLKKSIQHGNKSSKYELQVDAYEDTDQNASKGKASGKRKSSAHGLAKSTHNLDNNICLTGRYEGSIITYDWSGQKIAQKDSLIVSIEQFGNAVYLHWKEKDASYVIAEGMLTDSALIFNNGSYHKMTRYKDLDPDILDFKDAILQTISGEDNLTIQGNIQFYSKAAREPSKPKFLSIKSAGKGAAKNLGISETEQSLVQAYPNPFHNYIHLKLDISFEADYSLSVHSINGEPVLQQNLGRLSIGNFEKQLFLDVPKGAYILSVLCGKQRITQIIYKTN